MLVVFMTTRLYTYQNHKMGGEVIKIVLLQKRLFFSFFFGFHDIFPIFRVFPVQILGKHTFNTFFLPQISLFHFFSLRPHPPLIQKGGTGGAYSTCMFIFLLGHAHIWPKRGGGGHVPEMPPPSPPPRSTYASLVHIQPVSCIKN